MHRPSRRRGVIACLTAAAMIVAGCGSDDGTAAVPTTDSEPAATTAPDPTAAPSTTDPPPPDTTETTTPNPTTAGPTSLISDIPCDDPVPIDSMPDGQPTTEPFIEGDEVRWSSGDAGGAGDYVVIQRLDEPSVDEIATARESEIEFTEGPLTVSVVLSDSVSNGNEVFVFDDGSDCVRVVTTSPFLDDDIVTAYAQTLLASWIAA